MQSYTAIPSSQTIASSLALLLNNDQSANSQNSSTAFPTTNLLVGMPCFRTDLNQLYQLTAITPSATWQLVCDFNKTAIFAQDVAAGYLPLTGGSLKGKLLAINSANLLVNGSGELGNQAWTGTNFGTRIDSGNGGTKFGNGAAIGTSASATDDASDYFNLYAGAVTLQAEFAVASGVANPSYVTLDTYDSTHTLIASDALKLTWTYAQGAGFNWVTGTATLTGSVAYGRIRKGVPANTPVAGAAGVQFRRIKLESGSSPSTYSQEANAGYPYLSTARTLFGTTVDDSVSSVQVNPNGATWTALNTPTLRVVDTKSGTGGGLSIDSFQPTIQFMDASASAKNTRLLVDNGVIRLANDPGDNSGIFNAAGILFSPDGYMAVGSGSSLSSNVSYYANGPMVGPGTSQYGFYFNGEFNANATTAGYAFLSTPKVNASAFTMANLYGFYAQSPVIGTGATVTNYNAFVAIDFSGASNVYGFRGNMVAGANKWNLYMGGTASNFLLGRSLFGSSTDIDGATQAQIQNPTGSGFGLTVWRNATPGQAISIGTAPNGLTDNYVYSYSGAGNAKNLFIDSTTDSLNTTPTAGSVGINFRILGSTKLWINQAGRVGIGSGVVDDGSNTLQVGGNAVITATGPAFKLNDSSGTNPANLIFQSNGVTQWEIQKSLANNLNFQRFSAGAFVDNPISIALATGIVSMPNRTLMGGGADDGVNLLQANGTIKSSTGGFVFPDGTTQASAAAGRNRIINGSCVVSQRASLAVTTANSPAYAGPDRFRCVNTGAGGTITQSQGTITFNGVAKPCVLQVATAVATNLAGGNVWGGIQQLIEGYNAFDLVGQPVTVSFIFQASIAGTYSVALRDSTTAYSYVTTINVVSANTPQYYAISIPAVPAAATVPASNALGMSLCIGAENATGGTYNTSTLNAWQAGAYIAASTRTPWATTSGASIAATDIALVVGTAAMQFERLSYADTLVQCQRYYQTDAPIVIPQRVDFYSPVMLKVTMRSAPSVVWFSGATQATGYMRDNDNTRDVPVTGGGQTTTFIYPITGGSPAMVVGANTTISYRASAEL